MDLICWVDQLGWRDAGSLGAEWIREMASLPSPGLLFGSRSYGSHHVARLHDSDSRYPDYAMTMVTLLTHIYMINMYARFIYNSLLSLISNIAFLSHFSRFSSFLSF